MNMGVKSRLVGLFAAVVAMSVPGAALSSKVADSLTGTVTSVVGHEVVIDGSAYLVAPSPAADEVLSRLKAGQVVQLIFDQPPYSKKARVTFISILNAQGE